MAGIDKSGNRKEMDNLESIRGGICFVSEEGVSHQAIRGGAFTEWSRLGILPGSMGLGPGIKYRVPTKLIRHPKAVSYRKTKLFKTLEILEAIKGAADAASFGNDVYSHMVEGKNETLKKVTEETVLVGVYQTYWYHMDKNGSLYGKTRLVKTTKDSTDYYENTEFYEVDTTVRGDLLNKR